MIPHQSTTLLIYQSIAHHKPKMTLVGTEVLEELKKKHLKKYSH